MADKRDTSFSAPNILVMLWLLAKSGYDICFAFQIVGWHSFGVVAAASTFVMMLYSRNNAARGYNGNPFMPRHKRRMLPGIFLTLLTIIAIGYALKGTPYQIEFLGLFLAAVNLILAGIIILGLRRSAKTRGHDYRRGRIAVDRDAS